MTTRYVEPCQICGHALHEDCGHPWWSSCEGPLGCCCIDSHGLGAGAPPQEPRCKGIKRFLLPTDVPCMNCGRLLAEHVRGRCPAKV